MSPVISIKKLSFIIVLCFSNVLFGQVDQEIYNSKNKVVKKAGDKAFKNGDFFGAVAYYKKFLHENDSVIAKGGLFSFRNEALKTKYEYKLAEAYRLSRDYDKAEKTYHKVFKADPKKYPKSQFHLAHMQLMNGKYDEAKTNFEQFKKAFRKDPDYRMYSKWVILYIASCEAAPTILQDTLDVNIYHPDTSINKAHVEFSPQPLNDSTILYASLRSDSIVYVNEDDSNAVIPTRKFYIAKKLNDSTWTMEKEFADGWFNLPETENGNGCFSADSNTFFFSRGERNLKGQLIFHLYYAVRAEGDKWQMPVKMNEEINLNGYHSTQPTFGWNSQKEAPVLYFVSNREEGGKGGWDIWYSEYYERKKEWKKPKNAGSKLNTKLDEKTPNYDIETKTLYFSSEGWPGLGGMDIFKTVGELKDWKTPENMGYPINTSVDELYYVLAPKGDEGYFVSNRVGSVSLKNPTCCADIYNYKERHYIRIGVNGKVFELAESDEKTDTLPSKSVTLSLVLLDDSIKGGELVLKSLMPTEDGSYFFKLEKGKEYNIKTSGENLFSETFPISTNDFTESDTINKDFYVKRFSEQPIVVKNIYYEYDKSTLLDSSKTVLDTTMLKILADNPNIVVEIGSHTDSKGSDQYNEKLSQERAQSVVDYLLAKGINKKRLIAKGYGEKQPIAPNENPDGTDNPEGRQMNRRTEFKVIGTIEGISEIIYTK